MTFLTRRRNMIKACKKLGIDYTGRQMGKSTGQAMRTLGLSMKEPGLEVEFNDHHGTHVANKNQFELAKDIIARLGLEGFKFHNVRLSVVYGLEN